MTDQKGKVAIVGSGLIGRSWAMLFAGVGYKVSLFDTIPEQVDGAIKEIQVQLNTLKASGLLRGKLTAEQQFACITGCKSLKEAVADAIHVQECIPERLELKQALFEELDAAVTRPDVVLSSSSSTFMPSLFTEKLKHRSRALVAHPVNPPYYVPLVEVVPAPWTDKDACERTRALMAEIGQEPVMLNREIEGFALNRIQYVILNEAFRLVRDGVLNVQDVDKVMSCGLGPRYAFLGPLETAHLNAEGMTNYCDRYRDTMFNVCQTMGPNPKFEGPTVAEMSRQLEQMVPLEKLQERRAWRDKCLTRLSQLKKDLNEQ